MSGSSMTEILVANKYLVWTLALAAAIFGTLAYQTLPMQLFPDTAPPLVNVITTYPGASAEDVAERVSRPMEEEFASLEGVVNVKSSSQDNLSIVSVEFHYNREVDLAAVDAQNAISRIRSDLPSEIREPQVLKFSTADRPIITVGVVAEPMTRARTMAEDTFAPHFQRVPGVAAVDVFGGAKESVLVEVDREKSRAYNVPIGRIIEVLKTHNVNVPAGAIRSDASRTGFRIEGEARDLERLRSLPLAQMDASILRLGDIANVSYGALDDDATFGIDGERAIALQVYRTDEANTVEVVHEIIATTEVLKGEYPDVQFLIGEESASFTELSINNLLSNVWQALLLASIIIFLFIGRFKASMVAVVSMPLSYGLTFALMKLSGTEFNMVTLTAVILAVGMVVDAAVVVLENISRKMDEGIPAAQAAIEGVDEVRLAVLAGAATTIAVLLPLLFVPGFVGKTFGPLASILLFAFTSSIAVALTLVPVMSMYTGGAGKLDAFAGRITRPFAWLMEKVQLVYGWLLKGALAHRWLAVVAGFLMLVAGAGLMATRGMDVLPKMDGGSFFVSLQTSPGSSVEETTRVVAEIEKILKEEEEIVKIQSQAGFEPGMKTSSTSGAQGATQGFITVTLTPRTERDQTIWDIQERVRGRVSQIPNISTFAVRELGNTSKATTAAPVVVRLSGEDPLVLDQLADDVVRRLGQVPNVVEPVRTWSIDQERESVRVDERRAALLGLNPLGIGQQMMMGTDGVEVGQVRGGLGETTPVRVRYARDGQTKVEDLFDFPLVVANDPGQVVPLRSVVKSEPVVGQSLVTREQFVPTLEVTAFVEGRPLSFVTADVTEAISKMPMPQGYQATIEGENNDLGEAKGGLLGALGISVLAVYLLLVAQLRSWMHPLTIMASVPLSIIGVGLALKLAGKSISMPVMVGLILLVGIVVNNAIILIEFIRQAREQGMARQEAVLQSVQTRFRPIMMTSLSTIVGMIPLAAEWALGAERFSPLAVAVIGGMTTATFLTLVLIPVLYDISDDLSQFVSKRLGRKASALALIGVLVFPVWASAETPVLTIDEAVAAALETSPRLQAQEASKKASSTRVDQASRRRLPKLDLQANYSRLSEVEPGQLTLPTAMPGQEAPSVQFGEAITDMFKVRLTLTQPIFTGFAASAGHSMAQVGTEVAQAQAELTEADIRLQVQEVYLSTLSAEALTGVANESVRVLEGNRERVALMHREGRASDLDLARIDSRLAEAKVQQSKAQGQVSLLRETLRVLTGIEGDHRLVNPEHGGGEPFEGAFESALKMRPELVLARYRAEISEHQIDIASAALYPQLAFVAGYNYANPHERYFPMRNEFNGSWDLTLALSWTIWDWGSSWSKREEAQFSREAAQFELSELERGTELLVRRLLLDYQNAGRDLLALQERQEVAKEGLRVAQTLYEAGRASLTDVLDAELEYTRASAEVAQNTFSQHLILARLARQTEAVAFRN